MNNLIVIHRSKQNTQGTHADVAEVLAGSSLSLDRAFRLQTCQRELWIFQAPHADVQTQLLKTKGLDARFGAAAYRFLLSFACGLESEVKGETDVFGQLKQAWADALKANEAGVEYLIPWMSRVFEDTKEVRSRFLQNVGGASYGSLVRKILRLEEDSLEEQGPILLVGAGQLAESVAPWLADRELIVWNRSEDRAHKLVSSMRAGPRSNVRTASGCESEEALWRKAQHVVICIPADEARDAQRLGWFAKGSSQGARLITHLGVLESELPADSCWTRVSGVFLLDDLFALQKKSDEFRSAQFARADRACDEKAALRAMGGSLSVPHGWEDLALFA